MAVFAELPVTSAPRVFSQDLVEIFSQLMLLQLKYN
jgi:hypothetical protein